MQPVARFEDLAADRATEVTLGDETLILLRDGAAVRAFEGKCPHAGAPLAEGAVCDGHIVCPWHKAMFAVTDGALEEPPALRGLAAYAAEVRDGTVWVGAKQERPAPAPVGGDRHVLLLGAGAAAASCAAALREFGFAGAITAIGAEPQPPYDRTALSKFVLEGGKAPDAVDGLLPPEFYADGRVERIHATVARLDPAARTVSLEDGRTLPFTDALIATGGTPKTPALPGADLPGVFTLRSEADAAAIVARATKGGRAAILGSSFIGLEAASALRKRGLKVDVVTPEAVPFRKQFGEAVGAMFRRLHEGNGVRFHAETQAAALVGRDAVSAVRLENGAMLRADLVIVGVGVTPATGLAAALDRQEDGGITVDASMRAAPGVFAAGDVAAFPLGDGAPTRIEHWRVAQQHGRIAARNMAGGSARFDEVPFFWTYHYGKRFEYLGHATSWDEVRVDGDLDAQAFVALLIDAGRVVGAVACNREAATARLIVRMRNGISADDAGELLRGDRVA